MAKESTKKKNKESIEPNPDELRRIHRRTTTYNSRELKVIDMYCKKYKVDNFGKFCRETIISAILKQLDKDNPTLFNELPPQPNLFSHR